MCEDKFECTSFMVFGVCNHCEDNNGDNIRDYLTDTLSEVDFNFELADNKIFIDCAGNDLDFIRLIGFISNKIELWTYKLNLSLEIHIDTSFERVIIEY